MREYIYETQIYNLTNQYNTHCNNPTNINNIYPTAQQTINQDDIKRFFEFFSNKKTIKNNFEVLTISSINTVETTQYQELFKLLEHDKCPILTICKNFNKYAQKDNIEGLRDIVFIFLQTNNLFCWFQEDSKYCMFFHLELILTILTTYPHNEDKNIFDCPHIAYQIQCLTTFISPKQIMEFLQE